MLFSRVAARVTTTDETSALMNVALLPVSHLLRQQAGVLLTSPAPTELGRSLL